MTRTPALAIVFLLALPPAAAVAAETKVSTDVAAYTEEAFTGYKPQRIALVVNDVPDAARKTIEKTLVEELGKHGVVTVASNMETAAAAGAPDAKLTVSMETKPPTDKETKASAVLTKADGDQKVWHAVISIVPAGTGDQASKALANAIVATLTADGHLAKSK